MTTLTDLSILRCSSADALARLEDLAALMHACVHDGASIGYVLPFGLSDARTFWTRDVVPKLDGGARVLLLAEADGRVVGTVQLDRDTPPNQPHRAEVRKLMVHPAERRRGIARGLMAAIEAEAAAAGRSLLTLDTRTGDAAEPLYASMGYRTVGTLPGYCANPFDGTLEATTIMYKAL